MEKFFVIVLCHLIGDYVLQSDFIANTKGSNMYHLAIHCLLYALPFYIAFGWVWKLVLIAVFHFPIDLAKAKYKAITYKQDQILHYLLAMIYLIP